MATEKKKLGGVVRKAPLEPGSGAGGMVLQPELLEQVARVMSETGLSTLDWRRGDERLILRRGVEVVEHVAARTHAPAPVLAAIAPAHAVHAPAPAAAPVAVAPPAEKRGTVVTSPFVGTFYRAPSPDAPSFVEEGQTVRKGQVLCIIEAMKLMNEIEAEVAGKVVEVIGQNGQTVEFGQALFRIEPS